MTKLKAKLIVSDFDGTLITSDQRVLPEVREAIIRYVSDGGIFAVCTGRMLASILPRVRELGLSGLVCACQSSVIADIGTGKFIRCGGLSPAETARICKVIEECGQSVNVYSGNDYFTDIPEGDKNLCRYEEIIGVRASHPALPLSEYVLKEGITAQKVASLCFPEERERLFSRLRADFGEGYDVTCSADVLVEVSPAADTKGAGIEFLASHYAIDIKDTVAVGDNLNDLSMIEAAGVGVAVGNAVEELKRAADYVTVSNDKGAIARVIEKFGYDKH